MGQGVVQRIDRAIRTSDHLRRSPFSAGGLGNHKEWLHFCVHSHELDLLVNFSLVDDVRPTAEPGAEFARLVLLSNDGSWDGSVERYEPAQVEVIGGGIDLIFGPNRVVYDEGVYRITVRSSSRDIRADLTLRPEVMPALSNNIRMDAGTPINWVLVPRSRVQGTIEIAGRRHVLTDACGYHDHNWGHFSWGRDFTWEWCYALPEDWTNPWSVVFVRLLDRARTRTYKQGLFVWCHSDPYRIMRGRDIACRHRDLLRCRRAFKVPRVMDLLSPGTATDVPARVEISGRGEGDQLELSFESTDVAQVVIPSDTDQSRVTIINEVTGHLSLRGSIRGRSVEMIGPGIFEFVRA